MRRQHPETDVGEAEVPIEPDAPVEEAEVPAAPVGFDFGAVGEEAPPVDAPVGDGSFSFGATERAVPGIPAPPLDTTGDIATGEIQIEDLEVETGGVPPELPRRPSAAPPPRRKR